MGEKIFKKTFGLTANKFFQKYKEIAASTGRHVLLESGRGGRYSIAAFDPCTVVRSAGANRFEVTENGQSSFFEGNPLRGLKNFMADFRNETKSPIPLAAGGAIGYISYDYARYIESLPDLANDELDVPDVYFMFHKEWFVLDLQEEALTMFFRFGEKDEEGLDARVREWESRWTEPGPVRGDRKEIFEFLQEREVSIQEKEFTQAVAKVQEYIEQGDVFQVNLSVRQTKPIGVSAMKVYEQLREVNPSPYMGYFHTPEFQLVSGSPELLVKKLGREISTRPIAGTRSRGRNPEEDLELANELIESDKERAEHVMLVDLERNDLGKVSEYGTVEVNEFMAIEKYSHVMHIVSNVRGQISNGKDGFDLIDAVFPGGTITGAPKIRTMEIIEELEPSRRGPYTGSLGWIGFNDDLELNIMIRTMLVKDGQAHVQAGAGIVIDSNPVYEYKESLKKARALWKAKELAEAGENE
ncbi:anthranilate synthase component I family protein [Bacillus sp. B-jedd]|uniref:anthranilate synthase component I family protein n=1 Tax=Bacillus sp. B-jedd TaxID=1476857 RepID=UPI00051571CE|nr:anthranilate synthase component I family protein [Bacillus sp. B-jedd]CEG29573.1 para-aminobenzoate synthetase component I [Bacillus sp. B-jedd]